MSIHESLFKEFSSIWEIQAKGQKTLLAQVAPIYTKVALIVLVTNSSNISDYLFPMRLAKESPPVRTDDFRLGR